MTFSIIIWIFSYNYVFLSRKFNFLSYNNDFFLSWLSLYSGFQLFMLSLWLLSFDVFFAVIWIDSRTTLTPQHKLPSCTLHTHTDRARCRCCPRLQRTSIPGQTPPPRRAPTTTNHGPWTETCCLWLDRWRKGEFNVTFQKVIVFHSREMSKTNLWLTKEQRQTQWRSQGCANTGTWGRVCRLLSTWNRVWKRKVRQRFHFLSLIRPAGRESNRRPSDRPTQP